jgi:TP901 family phage tail tape measure protein
MADVNANINIDINTSPALANLRKMQAQITAFNESVISSNVAAAASQKQLNSALIQQVSAIKGFSTSIGNVETSMSRLGTAIEKNKLSLGEYFKYGVASSQTFGRVFSKEHNQVMDLATDRVKRLQTQYVALGESQHGMTRALAARPLSLFNADAAIATQRSQIFNKLLRDGSTSLVNFGKNTQWAGRQLMVGFTLPITMFGTVAAQVFSDLEKQIINFKRVYGDLGTTVSETEAMVVQIKALGKEYTKYGIAVSDTIGLAAKAAAMGAQGADLMAATEEATRLATLGQIEQNQALDATISLQTAFKISSEELASSIDFLNAVENQTVTSLDDITVAIPKVAPVIKGLGGDVKDLALFMTAMREGGVNAAEGANALKSGLASLINPTKAAREQLAAVGINIDTILSKNKGDLRGLVTEFGAALGTVNKFERQQTLAKVFGKYQFARMGALFENINRDGSQAQRVLDLTGASMEDLAKLSEKELGNIEQAVSVKFTAAVEKLKLAIAPIGEMFLKVATPIVNILANVADKFNELPDVIKTVITYGLGIGAVLVPSIIMLVGLLGNFIGNIMKIAVGFRSLMAKATGNAEAFQWFANSELDAMAAATSLEGATMSLTGALSVQRETVQSLATAYSRMAAAAQNAAANMPQAMRSPIASGANPRKMATGGFVAGRGNKDNQPALLTPGEFVVNKKSAKENKDVLIAINNGSMRKYSLGGDTDEAHVGGGISAVPGSSGAPSMMFASQRTRAPLAMMDVAKQLASPLQFLRNLTFKMSSTINRALSNGQQNLIEFETAWKDFGPEKWSKSISRTGLDFQEYGQEISKFDDFLLDEARRIAAIDQPDLANTPEKMVISDKNMEQAYPGAIKRLKEDNSLDEKRRAKLSDVLDEQYNTFTGVQKTWTQNEKIAMVLNDNIKVYADGVEITAKTEEEARRKLMAVQDKRLKIIDSQNRSFSTTPFRGSSAQSERYTASVFSGNQIVHPYTTAKPAQTLSEAQISQMRERFGIASASKEAKKMEDYVAQGMLVGAQKNQGVAAESGRILANAQMETMKDTPPFSTAGRVAGRGRRGATRPQGPANMYNAQGRQVQFLGMPEMPSVAGGAKGGFMSKISTAGTKFAGALTKGSAKLQGGMFALDGLVVGLSMMNNGVGEFAQKIMPVVFGLQGLTMMLPLLMGPMGIVAALGAVGVGLWMLDNARKEAQQATIDYSIAADGSARAFKDFAKELGSVSPLDKFNQMFSGVATEKQQEKLTAGQEFLKTEGGQALAKRAESLSGAGRVEGVLTELTQSIGLGIMNSNQAEGIAQALATKFKDPIFGKTLVDGIAKYVISNGDDVSNSVSTLLKSVTGDIDSALIKGKAAATQKVPTIGGRGVVLPPPRAIAGAAVTASLGPLMNATTKLAQAQAQVNLAYRDGALDAKEYANQSQRIQAQVTRVSSAIADLQLNSTDAKFSENLKMTALSLGMTEDAFAQMETQARNLESILSSQMGKSEEYAKRASNALQVAMVSGNLDAATAGSLPTLLQDKKYESVINLAVEGNPQLLPDIVKQLNSIEMMPEPMKSTLLLEWGKGGFKTPQEFLAWVNKTMTQMSFFAGNPMLSGQAFEAFNKSVDAIPMRQMTRLEEMFNTLKDSKIAPKIDFSIVNLDDLLAVDQAWNSLGKKKNISKIIKANDGYSDAMNGFKYSYEQLDSLPDITKKAVLLNLEVQAQINTSMDANLNSGNFFSSGAATGYGMQLDKQKDQLKSMLQEAFATPDGTGGPVDKSGGGDATKSWLEQLIADTNANLDLFPGMINKLKGKQIPDQIIEMIGVGEEGRKRAKEILALNGKKLNDLIAKFTKGTVNQAIKAAESRATEAKRKKKAEGILLDAGFTQEEASQVSSNSEDVFAIIAASSEKSGKSLRSLISAYRTLINTTKEAKTEEEKYSDALDKFNKLRDMMSAGFDAAEEAKRVELAGQFANKNGMTVEKMQEQVSLNQRLIDAQQKIVDGKQEEISDYQHTNDLIQQGIDDLQRQDELRNRTADALSHELELMSAAEEKIKSAYDKRIAALDEIQKINEDIANQQRQQLNLAQALSTGDVYAAAAAAQEMQASQAQNASDRLRTDLQQGMQNQIDGLRTAEGLTRAQAEQNIADIKEQSYQTSLLIRAEEDKIYQNNLEVRRLTNEIYNINESKIEPLQKQNDAYSQMLSYHQEDVETAIKGLTLAGLTREQYEKQSSALADAIKNAHDLTPELVALAGNYTKIYEEAKKAANEASRFGTKIANPAGVSKTNAVALDVLAAARQTGGGMGLTFSTGGLVPRKFARGGSVGMDSIPAMLTPGEFVMRKAAVDQYGKPLLSKMNMGAVSTPRYNLGKNDMGSIKSSGNGVNTIAPVYNTYSINVPVTQPGASADEIANKVMTKIRSVESSSIRRINGY